MHEAQDGHQGGGRLVEGDEPDAEELVHRDVQLEGGFVKRFWAGGGKGHVS